MSLKAASQASHHLSYRGLVDNRPSRASEKRHLRRAVRFRVSLGRYKLMVSCRRFTTPPHRRSDRFRQWVIPTPALSFKETAIAIKTRRSRARSISLRPDLLVASALVLVSMVGASYFAMHLKARPDLSVPLRSSAATALKPPSPRAVTLNSGIRQRQTLNLLKPVTAPPPKQSSPAPLPTVMPKSLPLRIVIPKIQLDTSIFSEGLGADGAISMPNVFDQVGWYDKSPTPGERGPAVLTGHVDSTQGIAIFWNLRELTPGDAIKIERQDGTTATFLVTDVNQFPQDKFPTQAVYGPVNYAGIRLITCGGTFSTTTGHYDQNTVVYGRLVN